MPRAPRSLASILNFSGSAAALVAKVRAQAALLALVKRELEMPLNEHLVAALMRGKQLMLYADSSAWASRLRFSSRALRSRLISNGLVIEKITIRIALPSGSKRGNKQVERCLSHENGMLIERTAETIDDPSLREALKRLSRHSR